MGVLVDLPRNRGSGHAKCWERFAQAAVRMGNGLDLTIHYLGDQESRVELSPSVRFITHPPTLSTAWFSALGRLPAHTDLSPFHSRLPSFLGGYDVIHTTDAFFSLARTALRYAHRHSVPIVSSVHTDTPRYTRVFTGQIIRRLVGERLARFLLERVRFPDLAARFMRRRLERYLARCDRVLVSREEDLKRFGRLLPSGRVSVLRRGIDKETFHPRLRDRERLEREHGIPRDAFLLLYVGRLDAAKNVMTMARAARALLDRGQPVRVLLVGEGGQREAVRDLLGPAAVFTGVMSHHDLAWLYASADLFVFPSRTEICPNVLIEAQASGLPVVVSGKGGSADLFATRGLEGVTVPDDRPESWAEAISSLKQDPAQLVRMGAKARQRIQSSWPSWDDVLREDLLPVWESSARVPG